MSSLELDKEVFKEREKISWKNTKDFRVNGSEDLKEHNGWDDVSKVGCLAFKVNRVC